MSDYYIGKIDLAQIECRILNTFAGQWDVVEKFRNGIDLYSELASQFYGFTVTKANESERGTGKQLELSCGYGAGGPTIVRTARAGTYGPPVYLTDDQGLAARDLYRGTHKQVVNLWSEATHILPILAAGSTVQWQCLEVHDHRIFHRQSGLWLDFTSLEYVTLDTGEKVWRHRVREGYRKTYGARLVENIIQWLARLVISEAMVRIDSIIGVKMPLTVHDDVFCLIPKKGMHTRTKGFLSAEPYQDAAGHTTCEILDHCRRIMEQPLTWLPRCPISAEPELLEALSK